MKALFHLIIENEAEKAGTNQLAEYLGVSPASVNSMLKKLKTKKLVNYQKYGKLQLSKTGRLVSLALIRKHRLWESFLYSYMNFTWDEVHDVAEQLEHIRSDKLIRELDAFMGHPLMDPHGDVIPKENGEYRPLPKVSLADIQVGQTVRIVSVKDSSVSFLQYIARIGLALSSEIKVIGREDFDGSMEISFDDNSLRISRKVAENVLVRPVK